MRLESQHQATAQVSVANSIGSLRLLAGTDWREFVETLSHVEHLLRADPADAYGRMDFATRDAYRHVVERTARRAGRPETAVAQQVLDMAEQAALRAASDQARDRLSHVGYYLLGAGRPALEDSLGIRRRAWWRGRVGPMSFHLYLGLALLIAVMLSVGPLTQGVEALQPPMAAIFGFTLLMFFGTLHLALALLNWLATLLVSPQALPRMDFSHGIPSESRTLVVVPTLLGSAEAVESMVDALELRFLANRDANLQFALLTDFHDAAAEHLATDDPLVELAGRRITGLNDKYRLARTQPLDDNDVDPFLLLHRPRRWNARERVWMGHERKRGKLADLNALLRGRACDAARAFLADRRRHRARCAGVRYVITLDTDTQLPRDSARADGRRRMAHPLNRPRFGDRREATCVVEGYGILQPRVERQPAAARPSRLCATVRRRAGHRPLHARRLRRLPGPVRRRVASSARASTTSMPSSRRLRGRFPENRDPQPRPDRRLPYARLACSATSSCSRTHRSATASTWRDATAGYAATGSFWAGCALALHMLPGSPANPLPPLSRWKLLDNLRRSLTPIALLWLLLLAWLLLPEPGMWTLRVLAILGLVPLAAQALEWLRTPLYRWRATPSAARMPPIGRQLLQLLHGLACLPYEAWVNADAIVRTLWRLNITRRHLLEWTASADVAVPAAQNERAASASRRAHAVAQPFAGAGHGRGAGLCTARGPARRRPGAAVVVGVAAARVVGRSSASARAGGAEPATAALSSPAGAAHLGLLRNLRHRR